MSPSGSLSRRAVVLGAGGGVPFKGAFMWGLLVFHAGFGSVREQCATPMDRLPPAWVACARSEPRALSSLGGGKGYGRGAEGVGPSHRKEGNGELGKGFGAKAITYWTAGEATEKGEGDQDAGSKPGRGRDADRGRMGSERHSIREREEREERRAHGPRSRPGKQQVDQHGRARLPHERARDARDGPGGEIEAGAHRKRRPVLALAGLTRPAARDRHQYGEAKDHCPGGLPHQERIGITEGDETERQPNETAERQAQQQPRRDSRQQPPKHNDRQHRRDDDDQLNCRCRVGKQEKERRREDGEAKTDTDI